MAEKSRTQKRSPAKSSNAQASRRGAQSSGPKPYVWGVTGLAVGLLVALLVHLEHTRPDAPATLDAANATMSADADAPRFEFYRLLTEQEVEVAREAETADTAATPNAVENPGALPSTQSHEGAGYLLQAGSFRSGDDAESLKANLALLGITASIQRVELPGGETWHRVRIGPFGSLQGVNGVRARMAAEQIDSILLRAGG